MKKTFLIATTLLLSASSLFAQRKELRDVENALDDGNVQQAQTGLNALSSSIESAEEKYKSEYYFLEGKMYYQMAKKDMNTLDSYKKAAETFQKLVAFEKENKERNTGDAKVLMDSISANLVNSAIKDNETKDYAKASDKLYLAYTLDTKNEDYLYYAAGSAVNAQEFDKALEYYIKLKDLGYTGVATQYLAKNKETGEVENLGSKQNRDLMVKTGQYEDPQEKQTEDRTPEIVKNIALIYTQNGENEKAVKAIKEARDKNPEDVSLLMTEANLYLKLKQKDKFAELMQEAIQKDPNNANLYFNLGVITGEQGDHEKAVEYYKKAINIDPKMENAYLNLVAEMLSSEQGIVDEMNKLGTSAADNKKYDELKQQREDLYKSAVPYLEKILEINSNNVDAMKTLMNIYGSIGETEKYKEMKDKLAAAQQ
ncbi:tetratricopeptide repeat protein [Zhouia sp. PK063]|uniref:tetratricopeptide repeat protein n=1 Tax=Zhouia sp. PK063 TaxID=3373602 RepID=UPI0037A6173A